MTTRQLYEYSLIELNKREAPSLLLRDFNYFLKKAINQVNNRIYNAFEVSQQQTDDLRVLRATAVLLPEDNQNTTNTSSLFSNVQEVQLPDDYWHLLNCVVEYKALQPFKCFLKDETWQQGARRLTSDMFGQIINNHYFKPTYERPYYYLNTVTTKNTLETDDITVDLVGKDTVNERGGNASRVRMEIRYGKDSSLFKLNKVFIDYLRTPKHLELTEDQVDDDLDLNSQILEYPDYVCHEIINELIKLVLENSSDPRLQTHIPVTQSIAMPGGGQQK